MCPFVQWGTYLDIWGADAHLEGGGVAEDREKRMRDGGKGRVGRGGGEDRGLEVEKERLQRRGREGRGKIESEKRE